MKSSIHKLIQQTKEDINTLKMAYEFTTNREFDSVNNIKISSFLHSYCDLEYMMWVYHSFNRLEYTDFLKKVVSEEIDLGSGFDKIKPMRNSPNFKSIEIIDRLDYSLSFLNKNFDIRLPSKVMPKNPNGKISITNEYYEYSELIIELELYISRIEMLQTNIDGFKSSTAEKSSELYRNEWIEKLTQNKFNDLLSELIQYFRINKEDDNFLKAVQLKQRFNKFKSEEQLNTINKQDLETEFNKITKAILEIIA